MTFTIVTITFNAAACLQRTLDSVLAQTYPDIEHLIVDGASRDNTVAMAQAYADKAKAEKGADYRVVISSEPDRGLYDAMNKGLQRASGDYLLYMNAGDSFPDSETLRHVAESIKHAAPASASDSLPAVAYGDTLWTDNQGNIIGKRNHSAPERLSWRSFKQGMLVCHQAFYARTDIAKLFPYDLQYRHSADVDWCIRIMKEAEKRNLTLVNTHRIVAHYQREGQTTANHRASLMERFHVMRRHYGLLTTLAMHAWYVVRAIINKLSI
ncbi:MAG: glycosyltransferase [Bacteroidaceae bacterium]|nr:glycosyltransferase [Bacteroidaceae bacterium]